MDSLYVRFGGPAAVSRLIFAFYDRVQQSERLAPLFAGVDMRRLVAHQAKFLASMMGGPSSYTDAQLREVHGHLAIEGAAFDEMLDHLAATLTEFNLPLDDADRILAEIRARRAHIARLESVTLDP